MDEVRLTWTRRAPEGVPAPVAGSDALNAQGMVRATFDGEVWTALLAGGFPVADYGLRLVASNGGGERAYPSEGEALFEVRALTGACVTDAGCLAGEVCHRDDGYCFTPPSPCAADAHCPRDQFCSSDAGLCRFYDTACAADTDCAPGYACADGACRAPCGGPCPAGYACDGLACVAPLCADDAACPAALPRCLAGRCAPADAPAGACTADGQCGAGRHCDLSAEEGRCRDGVRGRLCAPCGEGVAGAPGCGVDLVCLSGAPGCRLPCETAEDCNRTGQQNLFCDGGACVFDYTLCAAYECRSRADCLGDDLCEQGYCRPPQRCASDDDCAPDRLCGQGVCALRDACRPVYSDRCSGDALCVGGVCVPPAPPQEESCRPCDSDLSCGAQEVCVAGQMGQLCYRLCDNDTHCAGGETCQSISDYESLCIPASLECVGGGGW
ncbi:MAG: hypothetical protein FJ138_14730, partial [Deltaproteobacteria bacterium]|nr:hypothetical protein [Deltaproteobacteria bacterium]